jgi:hypothetical protein
VDSNVRPSSPNNGLIAELTKAANHPSIACPTWQTKSKSPHPPPPGFGAAGIGEG